MLTRNFTYCKHEELGHYGLKPNWMPNGDPFDGQGCTHDMLEHFLTQTSALEGECEAIGAMMHLRLENGWHLKYKRGPRELDRQVAAQLAGCLSDMACNHDLDAPTAVRTKPLANMESEAALQMALDIAIAMSADELRQAGETRGSSFTASTVRAGMEAWVRRGYRRAARRYARHDTYDISDQLFQRTAVAVDRLIKAELREGDQVGVSLDLYGLKVHMRVNGVPVDA